MHSACSAQAAARRQKKDGWTDGRTLTEGSGKAFLSLNGASRGAQPSAVDASCARPVLKAGAWAAGAGCCPRYTHKTLLKATALSRHLRLRFCHVTSTET
ncbi:hypothetical protein H920_17507 [Fukomys damarensis]|uniref:Uncharacterized protein n=1 Tax=Fukomys damarensis TaxID=885580 RepID=A0A091CPX7_FUKDA|nr:hypothetical protein H920_17507 [Fukomys damarensis]